MPRVVTTEAMATEEMVQECKDAIAQLTVRMDEMSDVGERIAAAEESLVKLAA